MGKQFWRMSGSTSEKKDMRKAVEFPGDTSAREMLGEVILL